MFNLYDKISLTNLIVFFITFITTAAILNGNGPIPQWIAIWGVITVLLMLGILVEAVIALWKL